MHLVDKGDDFLCLLHIFPIFVSKFFEKHTLLDSYSIEIARKED